MFRTLVFNIYISVGSLDLKVDRGKSTHPQVNGPKTQDPRKKGIIVSEPKPVRPRKIVSFLVP